MFGEYYGAYGGGTTLDHFWHARNYALGVNFNSQGMDEAGKLGLPLYKHDRGTSYEKFTTVYSRDLGLSTSVTTSVTDVVAAFQQGYVVTIDLGPDDFTREGHVMLLAGISNGDLVHVHNPNKTGRKAHTSNESDYSISLLEANRQANKPYIIIKP